LPHFVNHHLCTLGRVLHVDGRYWCEHTRSDPKGPISWRYKGAPGSGRSPDIAATSHISSSSSPVTCRRCAAVDSRPRSPSAQCRSAPSLATDKPLLATPTSQSRMMTTQLQRPVRAGRWCRAGLPRRCGAPNGLALRGVR
jgi:hypothetical protein